MLRIQTEKTLMKIPRISLPRDLKLSLLAGGALAGWVLTRGRRGVLAGGLATLVLAMAMGGPIPITATPRAAGLFASFLAIYTLCGAALVVIRAGLARATSRPSTAVS